MSMDKQPVRTPLKAGVRQTLAVARSLLSGPGGAEAALRLLERRVHEEAELSQSAAVWACIASLRSQQQRGVRSSIRERDVDDSSSSVQEMREVNERANLLRMAPVRVLTFDDMESSQSLPTIPMYSASPGGASGRTVSQRATTWNMSSAREGVRERDGDEDEDEVERVMRRKKDESKRSMIEQSKHLGSLCRSRLDKGDTQRKGESEMGVIGKVSEANFGEARLKSYLQRSARIGKCTAALLVDEATRGTRANT